MLYPACTHKVLIFQTSCTCQLLASWSIYYYWIHNCGSSCEHVWSRISSESICPDSGHHLWTHCLHLPNKEGFHQNGCWVSLDTIFEILFSWPIMQSFSVRGMYEKSLGYIISQTTWIVVVVKELDYEYEYTFS